MNEMTIPSLEDKILIVARHIYDHALLVESDQIESYQPSRQITKVLTATEYKLIIERLRRARLMTIGYTPEGLHQLAANGGFPTYTMTIDQARFIKLLQISVDARPTKPYSFDPIKSLLFIRGIAIRLGRTEGKRTMAYYIVTKCLKKPGKPITELAILDSYRPGDDMTQFSRTVESATRTLNKSIAAATGIDRLFVYGSGHVTFDDRQIKDS